MLRPAATSRLLPAQQAMLVTGSASSTVISGSAIACTSGSAKAQRQAPQTVMDYLHDPWGS